MTDGRPTGTAGSVSRRTALKSLAAAGAAGLAGCNDAAVLRRASPDDGTATEACPGGDCGGGCDLAVEKTHEGDLRYGETGTYTVEVCNVGEAVCGGRVVVEDDLPDGMTVAGGGGSGWVCSSGSGGTSVTCEHANAGGLAPGDCLPTLSVEVDVGDRDELEKGCGCAVENCASVEASADRRTENDTDCDETAIECPCRDRLVDLSTGTTDGVADAPGTEDPDWRVVASPDGTTGPAYSIEPDPSWATHPDVNWIDPYATGGHPNTGASDPLGDYVYETDFELRESWGDGQCELRVHDWVADDRAVLELDGPDGTRQLASASGYASLHGPVTASLGPGSYTLRARVHNGATVSGLLVNADVFCDCDGGDDGECDLTVTKEAAGEFRHGETGTYVVSVCNGGESACDQPLEVTDDLPDGTAYASASGTGWTFDHADGTVTATHPNDGGLAPGDCRTFEIQVDVGSRDAVGDAARNCATLRLDGAAPSDCIEHPVGGGGQCDLALTKRAEPEPTYDTAIAYVLDVCNVGGSECGDPLVVHDDLPEGVRYLGHSGSGWQCDHFAGSVRCEHPNDDGLAPGECETLAVEVYVPPESELSGDVLQNCAVLENRHDEDTSNNEACHEATLSG